MPKGIKIGVAGVREAIIMQNVTKASRLAESKLGNRVDIPRSSFVKKAAVDARSQGIKREKAT
ncbi:hypothetical protein J41TS12_01820 [Paenibacillus antibioticophila]|uniref:Uncharacterized protein n=1 Tax=Paenibacillus antibioticophila TaxID=1274374 RepID=A0A920CD11_9BACL|nr:hypothetical protein J41TS12_01820 [Paenibacillus antibioticophila]